MTTKIKVACFPREASTLFSRRGSFSTYIRNEKSAPRGNFRDGHPGVIRADIPAQNFGQGGRIPGKTSISAQKSMTRNGCPENADIQASTLIFKIRKREGLVLEMFLVVQDQILKIPKQKCSLRAFSFLPRIADHHLKTLTSLNKESRPFSLCDSGIC